MRKFQNFKIWKLKTMQEHFQALKVKSMCEWEIKLCKDRYASNQIATYKIPNNHKSSIEQYQYKWI